MPDHRTEAALLHPVRDWDRHGSLLRIHRLPFHPPAAKHRWRHRAHHRAACRHCKLRGARRWVTARRLAGGDVANVALALPGTDGNAWAVTQYRKDNASTPEYRVRIAVGSNVKRVDKAVLIAGPGVVPLIDLRLREDGVYQFEQDAGQTPPSVGANYDFEVTYDDGKICNLTAAVTGVWTSLPTALQPSGADAGSATPTFVWLAPGITPSTYWYRMNVWENPSGSDVWWTGLPSSYNTVVYNDDNRASAAALLSGKDDNWAIVANDAYGNIAAHLISFGVP